MNRDINKAFWFGIFVTAWLAAVAHADDTNPLVPFPSPLTAPSGGGGGGGGNISGTCATTNAIAFFSAATTLSCDADFVWTPTTNTLAFAVDTAVSLGGGVNGLNFDSDTLSIDAANNRVGVNNAAPGSAFHVVGNTRFQGAAGTDPIVSLYTAAGVQKFFMATTVFGAYCPGALADDTCFLSTGSQRFSSDSGGSTVLTLDDDGNKVGINKTLPLITGLSINGGLEVDNLAVAQTIATFKDNGVAKVTILDGGQTVFAAGIVVANDIQNALAQTIVDTTNSRFFGKTAAAATPMFTSIAAGDQNTGISIGITAADTVDIHNDGVIKWSFLGAAGDLIPVTDNNVDIGSNANRVKLVRAVTVTTGDLVMDGHEHGGAMWRLVEADDRIVIVNEDTGERFHMVMEAE